ncbi:MAG: hypothetical protein DCC75_10495 [Proteobacteria bacterium]|nr:MAG: hypothetical protein DCC75_10495 [Pseudomonadota bacterium]
MAKKNSGAALKVVHLSDLHLGYRRYNRVTKTGFNQREADVNAAFKECVDRCLNLKPHLILIAGDLFHSVSPSNSVITFCFKELRRLLQGTGAPIVLVAGNHETPRRADSGSILALFRELDGVYVADLAPQRFSFPKLEASVFCLPHASLVDMASMQVRADDKFRYNFLVAHAQVDDTIISDFGGVNLPLGRLSPHEWDYIALGHVHVRRNVALNASYSGSIEHTGTNIWFEAQTAKGFFSIDFPSATKIFHELTSPREVVVVEPIDAASFGPEQVSEALGQALAKVPGGVGGKIVRVELRNISRQVFRELDHRQLRRWRAEALNLSLDVKSPLAFGGAAAQHKFTGSLERELTDFCAKAELQYGSIEKIAALIGGYMKKLEEADEAR